MRRLSMAEVGQIHSTPGKAALLFITDRCPVGCTHCSVDSRPDSPKITDFALFERVVAALCRAEPTMIGVSGGEPFVERRGLAHAAERVTEVGKDLVVYTSGVWAGDPEPPSWIRRVIELSASVFLSTDAFHQDRMASDRFSNAARAVAGQGVPLAVQVLDMDRMVDQATRLLEAALGRGWRDYAAIRLIPPLPYGRAHGLFDPRPHKRGSEFGRCHIAAIPVARYNGVVTVCCNENVIMGQGPSPLRRRCDTTESMVDAINQFTDHPLFTAMRFAGLGALTAHPMFSDLADQQFASICQLCWAVADRDGQADNAAFYRAVTMIGEEMASDDHH